MPPSTALASLLDIKPFTIFLCLSLLCITYGKLIASSQRLVEVGHTFHAECHYDRADVDRFLYWALHYYPNKHGDHESHDNFGGIDLSTCSPFSFDASNAIMAVNNSLLGLTGHIGCDLDAGPMRLYIHNIQPEYNGLRFSCTSGYKRGSARSNQVTLLVGKPRLVTLEIEDTGSKHRTSDGGDVLRATCRVDRSLNPRFLFWATRVIDDANSNSTFGGMVLDFCYRYKVRGLLHRKVDFNCKGPPDFVSTLKIKSLPSKMVIFCYTLTNSSEGEISRIESNWLAISDRGRFTKILLSTKSPSVQISGIFYAKCQFLSNSIQNDCQDSIRWRGLSKFGNRVHVSCNKNQKESLLIIKPIYASDNKSQIFCYVIGEATSQIEGLTIKVTREVPISLEILKNESTINPVAINGLFQVVCSLRNINVRTIVWVAAMDNVEIGKVSISGDVCRTRTLIKDPATVDRVKIFCDLEARTTTLTIQPVIALDAGTEVYCAAVDQYEQFIRSDSLTLKTKTANETKLVKIRPAYKNATLLASCLFENSTEHIIFIDPVGEYRNGSDDTKSENFILLDKNCTVIANALYLPRRFFIGCDSESETVNLIIDPVYNNSSDDFQVTCARYVPLSSSNVSSASIRKLVLKTRQFPQLVYPVSKPTLNFSGNMIVINGSDPGNWKTVWLIPVVADQELEFTCIAGPTESSSFDLSLYIQTNEDYVFQYFGVKSNPNTTTTFSFKSKFLIKESYRGIFCAARNIVSRWESDFARFVFRNVSVFIRLPGWVASDSTYFMNHKTPNLKMCYQQCEVYRNCQGISYRHEVCFLSNSSLQDLQLNRKQNDTFYQRFQPEDILQQNDFRSDIYIKHENQTISLHGMLTTRKGLTVTECQKLCTEILPCRSILYHKDQKICHLSKMESIEKDVSDINPYDWDSYTKNNTPGSFVVIRSVLPDTMYHVPVATLSQPRSGYLEHKLMQCADSCRERDDCASFVSVVSEEKNSVDCLFYDVNIPDAQLVKNGHTKTERNFYVRVRSINSELVLVRQLIIPTIS